MRGNLNLSFSLKENSVVEVLTIMKYRIDKRSFWRSNGSFFLLPTKNKYSYGLATAIYNITDEPTS
jgi:hypothetical protein